MSKTKKLLLFGGGAIGIIVLALILVYGTGDLFKASLQLPEKQMAALDSDRTAVKKVTPPKEEPKEDPTPTPTPTPTPANVGSSGGGGGGPLPRRPVKRTPATDTVASVTITEQKAVFGDTENHKFKEAINYIAGKKIVNGYPDGTYRADNTLNRAEMLKIIILAMESENVGNVNLEDLSSFTGGNCFTDVGPQDLQKGLWYPKYACYGKKLGVVEGYPDGTFRPGNPVSFVEAVKMTLYAFNVQYAKTDPWTTGIISAASSAKLIPIAGEKDHDSMSRGSMAELIYRAIK